MDYKHWDPGTKEIVYERNERNKIPIIVAALPGTFGDIIQQERIVSEIMNALPDWQRNKYKAVFATSKIGDLATKILSQLYDSAVEIYQLDDRILDFLKEILDGPQTYKKRSLRTYAATKDMYSQMLPNTPHAVRLYCDFLTVNGFFDNPLDYPRILILNTGSCPCLIPIVPLLRALNITVVLIDELGNTPIKGSAHESSLIPGPTGITNPIAIQFLKPIIRAAYNTWAQLLPNILPLDKFPEMTTDFDMATKEMITVYPIANSVAQEKSLNEQSRNPNIFYSETIGTPPPFKELPDELRDFLDIDDGTYRIFINQGSFEFQDQNEILTTLNSVRELLQEKDIYVKFIVNGTTGALVEKRMRVDKKFFYILDDPTLMAPLVYDSGIDIIGSTFGAGTTQWFKYLGDGKEFFAVSKVADQAEKIATLSQERNSRGLSSIISLKAWDVPSIANAIETAVKRIDQKDANVFGTREEYFVAREQMALPAIDSAIFILRTMQRQALESNNEQMLTDIEDILANLEP